jgi:hypothetical protein
MVFVPVKIPPGIEREGSPYDSTNRWWDMSGVRWISGTMQPIGGWSKNTATPLDSPVRAFRVWRDLTDARAILAATDEKLYVDASGSYQDITPDGYTGPGSVNPAGGGYGTGPYGDDTYGTIRSTPSPIFSPYGFVSFGQWGEDVILCSNSDGRLLYYDQSSPLDPPTPIGPSYAPIASASFTGAISGTTLTVSSVTGTITVGAKLTGTGITDPTTIVSGAGATWTISRSLSVSSEPMESFDQTTTGAPVSNYAVTTTDERHVMAIGAGGDPGLIAWSSREDPSDWDYASLTNTAGFLRLNTKSRLLMGIKVTEGTLVFSRTDVFLIRYVGQPSIYGGTAPISDASMFNPSSVVSFGGKAAWPGRQGFQLYSGGYVQPLPCPVWAEIMDGDDPTIRMDSTWGPFRIHGGYNFRFPELLWFYPSVGQTECDRYLAWNYVENFWFWGSLARSAMAPADAFQYPLMGGSDSHVYTHEFGDLANGVSRVGEIWVESGALGLGAGDQTASIDQMQLATGRGYGNLSVEFIGTYTPEGQEYTEGPFTPRDDGYTDCRLDYRDVRLRLSAAQDGNFSVGLIRLDVRPSGGR